MTIKQLRKQQAKRRAEKRRAKAAPKKRLAEWSRNIRDIGECEVCGAKGNLQAHHILPKERYPEFKFELMNGISLCPICHKFGKHSAHRNPLWFILFLKRHASDRYNWAKEHMGTNPLRPL